MSPHKIDDRSIASTLRSYGISKNGFLPNDEPLQRLPQGYFDPWEAVVEVLPLLLEARTLRGRVERMPVLSASRLNTEQEWQRAYVIMTLLAQAYIWADDQPSQRLPPSITVPLLETSEHLEVKPIASYAGLNLWNWQRRNDACDLTDPANIEALNTLTGSEDESWFYVISVAMEARAVPIIRMMLSAIEAADEDNGDFVISALSSLRQSLNAVADLLERMDERCDPQYFYHRIRPLLAGSVSMEDAGLDRGIFYDEDDGNGSWRKYRGGSNGQSSLIQFFDAVLGVEHFDKGGFHKEMRKYMPGPHAKFLEEIDRTSNIRSYVNDNRNNAELVAAYNGAVQGVHDFRTKHIQLVSRYIILPSRQSKPAQNRPRNLAGISSHTSTDPDGLQELVGTGGTKLVPFLKRARDETGAASV